MNNNRQFVIVSNNCWGAEIYKTLGSQYNTPFVGLFIYGPDYLKLLKKLDFYLSLKLSFTKKSKWINPTPEYPIGQLNDIEIHFVHYEDENHARLKWELRLSRMQKVKSKDDFYFKICDRDQASFDIIKKFHKLPFKNKISFGISEIENECHIRIKENEANKTVPHGLALYTICHNYVNIFKWIATGKLEKLYM